MDIFPSPGPFSQVSIQVVDEQGRVIVHRQTNSATRGVNRFDINGLFEIQNTIDPDCTGQSVWTLSDDVPSDHPLTTVFGLQSSTARHGKLCYNGVAVEIFLNCPPIFPQN